MVSAAAINFEVRELGSSSDSEKQFKDSSNATNPITAKY